MKLRNIILSAIVAAGCLFSATGCNSEVTSSVGNIEKMNFVDGDILAEITIEGYGTMKAKLFPDLAPNAVKNFTLLAEQGYYDGLKIHRVVEDMFIQGGSLNGDGTGGVALLDEDNTPFDLETSPKARHIYGALSYAGENGKNATQFFVVTNKTPADLNQYDPAKITEAAQKYTDLIAAEESSEAAVPNETYSYMEGYYTSLAEMITSADDATKAKYMEVGGLPMFDGGYTVFGQIYEGLDILDKLAAVETEVNPLGEKSRPIQKIIITSVDIVTYKAPTTAEATEEDTSSKADAPERKPQSTAESSTKEADSSTMDSGTAENSTIQTIESGEAVQQ